MEQNNSTEEEKKSVFQILLVEDDPSDVRLIQTALKQSSVPHQVNTVRNGRDAIAYLHGQPPYTEAQRPGVVLLDLNMPGIDGREVLRVAKENDRLKDLPIIVLSTSSYEKDIEYCLGMKVNSYIVKPVFFEGYDRLIKEVEVCYRESSLQ